MPIQNILPKLIAAEIITYSDREEIDSRPKTQDKASFVLNLVDKSLQADNKQYFYSLLNIMKKYGGPVTQLANEILEKLK